MVMDLEEGRPLSELLEEHGILMEQELKGILHGLLNELGRVHEAAVLHRDIKPSNILIRSDGSPVLIDFGAARKDVTGSDRSTIAVFSPAYAALEQICPIGSQGPWTDIYGFGATLYRATTGSTPITAAERLEGKDYVPVAKVVQEKYSPSLLAAIDAALELYPETRPQSVFEWKEMFVSQFKVKNEATILRPTPKAVAHPPKTATKTINTRLHLLVAMIVLITATAIGWEMYRSNYPPGALNGKYSDMSRKDKKPEPTDKQMEQAEVNTFPVISDDQSTDKKRTSFVQALLKVHSVPTQARIVLDGKEIGITPAHIKVGNGMHSLRLSLKGYYEWESNLLIEDKVEIPIQIPLLKK
jgi:serine/threonine protein kinase